MLGDLALGSVVCLQQLRHTPHISAMRGRLECVGDLHLLLQRVQDSQHPACCLQAPSPHTPCPSGDWQLPPQPATSAAAAVVGPLRDFAAEVSAVAGLMGLRKAAAGADSVLGWNESTEHSSMRQDVNLANSCPEGCWRRAVTTALSCLCRPDAQCLRHTSRALD